MRRIYNKNPLNEIFLINVIDLFFDIGRNCTWEDNKNIRSHIVDNKWQFDDQAKPISTQSYLMPKFSQQTCHFRNCQEIFYHSRTVYIYTLAVPSISIIPEMILRGVIFHKWKYLYTGIIKASRLFMPHKRQQLRSIHTHTKNYTRHIWFFFITTFAMLLF